MDYWHSIVKKISDNAYEKYFINRIEFIPDREIEIYFKAAMY